MGDWEDKVVQDVKNGVPRGLIREVLSASTNKYGGCEGITIVYPDYPGWLKKTDPNRQEGISDSVKAYRRQRDKFIEDITKVLDGIKFYDAGAALMDPLCELSKELYIRPYTLFHAPAKNAVTGALGASGIGDQEATLQGTSTGMPNYKSDGSLGSGGGLGKGTDTAIDVSPEMWSGGKDLGAGTALDDVVFHEMVHAFRLMSGTFYQLPVNQGYDHEEEFLAIVLTNIYLSEKNAPALRARHQLPNTALLEREKFLDNVQKTDLTPIVLIERFRLSNPKLYRNFADITKKSAKFNPVREFDERRKAGRIKFK